MEIRKFKDQVFSPWKGLFNHYGSIYVIADERSQDFSRRIRAL